MSSEELDRLIEKAHKVDMSEAERQHQRISFAYGNTRIENNDITWDTVVKAEKDHRRRLKGMEDTTRYTLTCDAQTVEKLLAENARLSRQLEEAREALRHTLQRNHQSTSGCTGCELAARVLASGEGEKP